MASFASPSVLVKLLAVCTLLLLAGCDRQRVYEEYTDLPDRQWAINRPVKFSFQITDPTQKYHIYYLIRNSVYYPYSNLYVTHYLRDAQTNLLSSKLQNIEIADEKTGRPFGDGLGDLFDHQVYSLQNFSFPRSGTYSFEIKQYMRQNPLPEVMSVGIRVEKAE